MQIPFHAMSHHSSGRNKPSVNTSTMSDIPNSAAHIAASINTTRACQWAIWCKIRLSPPRDIQNIASYILKVVYSIEIRYINHIIYNDVSDVEQGNSLRYSPDV